MSMPRESPATEALGASLVSPQYPSLVSMSMNLVSQATVALCASQQSVAHNPAPMAATGEILHLKPQQLAMLGKACPAKPPL